MTRRILFLCVVLVGIAAGYFWLELLSIGDGPTLRELLFFDGPLTVILALVWFLLLRTIWRGNDEVTK